MPFFFVTGVGRPEYTEWSDGSYPMIARTIGDGTLSSSIVVSSLLGNLGLFIAEMTKDGYQLTGMADLGVAPKIFSMYVDNSKTLH